ncbi:uncharacterized protein LOC113854236 [Abrus precatorius]|uniref:Uncharacterized protein LOC113854236 n=1 Tax=Abrus precatorius TaxID=3816 RepID=A0A8B8KCZ6_ABRPR|nr:uncharacterized protein LOC113854236 [Abrus precatorius]
MKVVTVPRQLDNLISYKSILENLRNEIKNLQQKRQRVQENLTCWDSEEFQTKSKWLNRTDEFLRQVNVFVNYYEGKGSCTNFLWWYKVNKQGRKMMQEMLKLQKEGNLHLLVKPPKDYKAPKSRADTINDIMEALKDPLIQIVGVWWLGGGGTTLLAKQIGDQAEEQNFFKVVIIDIAEKPSVEQVQEDIEAILGLQFHGEIYVKRRNRLRLRIKKTKRILIIINDTWGELNPQELDLDEIGVPLGDEHKGCKLLLISKSLDFIQNLMGAPKAKIVQLEVLLEEEAQILFEKMVGGIAQNSEASSIITEIVKSCEGLAPAVFAIAKVLENKDLHALQNALMQLKEHVAPIRLCYNSLESEEHKFLLLILTLRGRRAVNKHSIYVDMWEGLLKNLDTLEAARSRCDSLISDLKAYGLLIEDENENVKINDLIWHTAYSIAQNDLKALVISKEWPTEEWLRSLRFCNITIVKGAQVPEMLQCPEMQEIILSTDNPSMQVPNLFFDETKLLKVLELIGFDCSKLPSSFGSIKNLQALSMYNCKLGDITIVSELTNLQILGLFGSRIQQLPREIGRLQKLLILDLRDTYLQVIPSNVISNLTSLEELYLRNSFCNWEVEISNSENKNASLKELTNLHHLTCIEELYVPDPQAWPMDLYFEKIKSYTIFIGNSWVETHNGDHGLKVLKLKLNRQLQLKDGIKRMMKNVDVLHLDELYGVQNVLSDLDGDGFLHLQSLFIQNNAEIKCIAMSSSDDHHIDAFPNIESLSLKRVSNLKYICHGSLSEKSFFKIKVIRVQQCHEMTCLFSDSMIKSLPHLVDLEVSKCKLIEAIVVGGEKRTPTVFPQLRSLSLQGLPALFCFYTSSYDEPPLFDYYHDFPLFDDKISCPNLERMVISKVIKLNCIWDFRYNVANSFWKLKNDGPDDITIDGDEELSKAKELCDHKPLFLSSLTMFNAKNCSNGNRLFQFLCYLEEKSELLEHITIEHCITQPFLFGNESSKLISLKELVLMELPDMMYIWKTHVRYIKLNNLRNLYIKSCLSLMLVFPYQVNNLSQLNELKIQECGNLTKVIQHEYHPFKFLALSKVELMYLPELIMFHTNTYYREFPVLETLVIEKCPKLQIFTHGLATAYHLPTDNRNSFFKLNELRLDTCHTLVYVISSNRTLQEFPKLMKLTVSHCTSLKMIFNIEEEISCSIELLQQLTELILIDLPNLTHIINKEIIRCYKYLQILEVKQCKSLKSLQASQMLTNMQVSDCESLEKIIMMDEGQEMGENKSSFPLLKYVSLENLTKLTTVFPSTSQFPSLETLIITNCPALITFRDDSNDQKDHPELATSDYFFPNSLSLEKLKVLCINQDIEKLWHYNCPPQSFCELENLTLRNNKLLNVITSNMIKRYDNLKSMTLDKCELMTEVFNIEDDKQNQNIQEMFPQLRLEILTLSDNNLLLRGISSNMITRYNNLINLTVDKCELLTEVFYLNDDKQDENIKEMLPQLKALTLSNLKSLTYVWNKEPQVPFFPNLVSLNIVHCGSLKSLFSCSATKNLSKLKLLKLCNCQKIEKILSDDKEDNVSITFPEVECLILKDLPKLISFCQQSGTIDWPKLQKVSVSNIPSMKTFSDGQVNTPLLRSVHITFVKKYWLGNLNNTIAYIHHNAAKENGIEATYLAPKDKEDEH